MTILDKYVLSQTMRRLTIALGIVLLTLVLERVLRLFEFAAANNAAFGLVIKMAVNLLPHYLGLALPAAFFISVLLLMAQLGDNSELDVILGSGQSVSRIARPVIIVGFAMSLFSVGLLGYLQPLTRYGYRAIRYVGTNAFWTEAISKQKFYAPAEGVTIFANGVDLGGSIASGVFVHQIDKDGIETTITAKFGHVATETQGDQAQIVLEDVVQIVEQPDEPPYVFNLKTMTFTPDFLVEPGPFRPRGDDARELTLGELARLNEHPEIDTESGESIPPAKLNAELNARLVRSASVAVMPFLAVPMGMAAKRRRRGAAIATASIMLLLYHYALQLGEGLVGLGMVSPLFGLWIPLAVFALLCMNLLRRIDRRLRPDPFEKLFDWVDSALKTLNPRNWFKRQSSK